jgi:hypothetical protein
VERRKPNALCPIEPDREAQSVMREGAIASSRFTVHDLMGFKE